MGNDRQMELNREIRRTMCELNFSHMLKGEKEITTDEFRAAFEWVIKEFERADEEAEDEE